MTTGEHQVPQAIYATFIGGIDQQSTQRIFQGLATATAKGIQHVHLLFQSAGGIIGDGIALYNFFRTLPIELSLYNVGTVASVGAIAYLGAKTRKTSTQAAFMVHRTQALPQAATAERLHALAYSVAVDDKRIENILKQHLDMPDDKWRVYECADLWISSHESVKYGMATAIDDFSPPRGIQIFNI